jgi:hypothetical protein
MDFIKSSKMFFFIHIYISDPGPLFVGFQLLHRAIDRVVVEPIPLPGGTQSSSSGNTGWTADALNKAVYGYFNGGPGGQAASVALSGNNASSSSSNDLQGMGAQKQRAFLRLKCKNFMQCCFEMGELADAQAIARSIETLSNLSVFSIFFHLLREK